jgi:biopolymer transport protein ExbD
MSRPFVIPRPKKRPEIILVPLIDILLNLLIFFMLIASYINLGITLTLPAAKTASGESSPYIVVAVDSSLRTYVNGEPVAFEQLGARLAALHQADASRIVRLRVDRSVPTGTAVAVLDLVCGQGFADVVLDTAPEAADSEARGGAK